MQIIKDLGYVETSHIVRGAYTDRCSENIHGHSGRFKICISGKNLDESGMVIDFTILKPLKKIIDIFDHSCTFSSDELPYIISFFLKAFKRVNVMRKNPTAENMARLLFKYASDYIQSLGKDVKVEWVEYFETVTGSAIADTFDENDIFDFCSVESMKETKGVMDINFKVNNIILDALLSYTFPTVCYIDGKKEMNESMNPILTYQLNSVGERDIIIEYPMTYLFTPNSEYIVISNEEEGEIIKLNINNIKSIKYHREEVILDNGFITDIIYK